MNLSRRDALATLMALGATASPLTAGFAQAQTFPSRPIRLIAPFAPGGTTDLIARIVSDPLGAALGQTVVVENRAGGGGAIGAYELVRSPNDGHVLGMSTSGTVAAVPAMNPRTPYDPLTDKTPIIIIAATPNVIAVHPSFPARDYATFLEVLRRNPGQHSYASSGTGGVLHLLMEAFKALTRTFIVHIPFRGGGPALQAAVAGHVPIVIDVWGGRPRASQSDDVLRDCCTTRHAATCS
jgi:tripartite-type tricarboxylate transporter receptor subunit TctC